MKRAFLFPGQGSQKVGMGRALADDSPTLHALFETADEALGFKLSTLCFEGPESELQLTFNTQPAILTVSVAAWRALVDATGWSPSVVAGHSLGEYSALVCAGAIDFADAVKLVHLRGRFMQEAVPAGRGAMAAIIGLDARAVEETCAEAGEPDGGYVASINQETRLGDVFPNRPGIPRGYVASINQETRLGDVFPNRPGIPRGYVAPANFNGAGQVVIAGEAEAVAKAMILAKAKGAKLVKLLPVSAPFHCRLMQPAADRLRAELERVAVRAPSVPIVSNVEAQPYREVERIKELLVRQVTAPVRWEESVRALAALGVEEAIELGPGKVLSGLVKRIAPAIRLASVEEPAHAAALARPAA